MKSTRFWKCCLLTALLICASKPVWAIKYDIEIIVFEHTRKTAVGISDTLLFPVIPDAVALPQLYSLENLDALENPIQPLTQLRLHEHADSISNSANHRLLYHGGWRQPDYDQETAPYIQIAIGPELPMFVERREEKAEEEEGEEEVEFLKGYAELPLLPQPPLNSLPQPGSAIPADTTFPDIATQPSIPVLNLEEATSAKLYGGIKVWVGRFLHFDTMLAYTPRGGTRSFQFKSDRRMRSRQLHYIDNTRVGIITKIFPVDDTAPN
ncbi:hypothetical protein AB833_14650 [Chromatiales bacterium (ex Bugula neritina AB1)]|nr:hypothetical protein AB833_14650 [Chromatiales bacterium (ex Bugula neritina AB1)]